MLGRHELPLVAVRAPREETTADGMLALTLINALIPDMMIPMSTAMIGQSYSENDDREGICLSRRHSTLSLGDSSVSSRLLG